MKDQRDLYIAQLTALLQKKKQLIGELYVKLTRAQIENIGLCKEISELKGELYNPEEYRSKLEQLHNKLQKGDYEQWHL